MEADGLKTYRVVLDPGVLVSGLISARGAPRALLLLWLDGSFELITCPTLLAELRRVLMRPKFRSYVTLSEIRAALEVLSRFSSVAPDPAATAALTPDPDDDYLVALALSGGAHFSCPAITI